ncbi:MAG: RsmE family RNA methyltransferase, partial [Lachnospiraceae bacterium]|nr:RsmE family RNA methyltransferase [Lachnospiraceae bacterium]
MQQIFINEQNVDGKIRVVGDDARHLIKVCRIKMGEKIRVSTSGDENYLCEAESIDDDTLVLNIIEEVPTTELPCTIKLYQALPKGDRMETIIEKCTELGVSEVIPVEMKYCVVKLDDKKKAKKVERYQNIARSAAQQSKRSVIPTISNVISFKEAVADAAESDIIVVPYENKNGMKETV